MAEILLTPETLRNEASRLDSARINQQNVLQAIDRVVARINDGWEGKSQSAFRVAYNEKRRLYVEFANDMVKFSQFLRDYAATMENVDASNSGRVFG